MISVPNIGAHRWRTPTRWPSSQTNKQTTIAVTMEVHCEGAADAVREQMPKRIMAHRRHVSRRRGRRAQSPLCRCGFDDHRDRRDFLRHDRRVHTRLVAIHAALAAIHARRRHPGGARNFHRHVRVLPLHPAGGLRADRNLYPVHLRNVRLRDGELVEIAVRALSPGINDPTTAVLCVDRLGAALAKIAARPIPSSDRYGCDGRLRIVAKHYGFRGLVGAAFNPVRQYGARAFL